MSDSANRPEEEQETPQDPKAEGTTEAPPWKRQLESSLGDLKSMGNDIRQRLEQAGKSAHSEAKDAWKKLEPQLGAAEAKLVEATDEAVEQIKGLFGKLRGSLENLRGKLG